MKCAVLRSTNLFRGSLLESAPIGNHIRNQLSGKTDTFTGRLSTSGQKVRGGGCLGQAVPAVLNRLTIETSDEGHCN